MSDHTVAIHYIHALLQSAHRAGLDIDELLDRSSLPRELLGRTDTRATPQQCMKLVRRLSKTLDDELLGLGTGRRRCGTFSIMGLGAIHAPDLGTALERCARFTHIFVDDPYIHFHHTDDLATIELEASDQNDPYNMLPEMILCVLHRFLEWLVDAPLELKSVELTNEQSAYHRELGQIFGCQPVHGAPRAAISFSASALTSPTVRSHSNLVRFTSSYPACILHKRNYGTTLTERIRALIENGLVTGIPSPRAIATTLTMSEQTLRRKLAALGTSISEIKNEVFRDFAVAELARGATVDAVAARLDFSTVSAFHRAFKRWTGVTPATYRRGGGRPVADLPRHAAQRAGGSHDAALAALPVPVSQEALVQFTGG